MRVDNAPGNHVTRRVRVISLLREHEGSGHGADKYQHQGCVSPKSDNQDHVPERIRAAALLVTGKGGGGTSSRQAVVVGMERWRRSRLLRSGVLCQAPRGRAESALASQPRCGIRKRQPVASGTVFGHNQRAPLKRSDP
jgi:hypothetical protein